MQRSTAISALSVEGSESRDESYLSQDLERPVMTSEGLQDNFMKMVADYRDEVGKLQRVAI
jgi:hypothetical protein